MTDRLRTAEACGTASGYRRHGRNGEPHCEPCRAAWRGYMQTYRRARQPAARPSVAARPMPGGVVTARDIAAAVAARPMPGGVVTAAAVRQMRSGGQP